MVNPSAGPASTSADLMLDQMVRVSDAQFDSDNRISTRAGAVLTLSASALVASIALFSGVTPLALLARVLGWLFLSTALAGSGTIALSYGLHLPPRLTATNVALAMGSPVTAAKQSLVMAYLRAITANKKTLERTVHRINLSIGFAAAGILALAISYYLGKIGW
jgi:hypothetical protein